VWSNLRSGDSQVSRRTVLSALGAAFLGGSAGCSHPMPPPQGIVMQKGIFGERNDRAVSLLKVTDEKITVHDDILATVLPRSDNPANTTVAPSLHEQLKQRYDDVYYYVDIRKLNANGPLIETKDGKRPKVPVVGRTPRYIISREIFGKILVNDHIEYTLSLFDRETITAITIILRNGVIQDKQRRKDSNSNAPPFQITISHDKRPNDDLFTLTYFAKTDIYKTAQIGMEDYFKVIFKSRTRPTIQNFSPNPYGNL
jgi:hypothetical protein